MAVDDFFEQERWADVEPIQIPDNDSKCAQIMYLPEYAEAMGYFRAIVKMGELSPRAFELTGKVIAGNAANYTAWQYRRECLFAMNASLEAELEFVTYAAIESPKNYQIWFHRRAIVDKLGDGSKELAFIEEILNDDAKNYHAWSYRQFVLQRFGLFDGELDYVARLIQEDVRNNSAWNQRYFVVSNTTGFVDEEVRKRELEYAFGAASATPNNESPFNYIKGIMRLPEFLEVDLVCEFAENLYTTLKERNSEENEQLSMASIHPPPLLALIEFAYEKQGKYLEAIQMCNLLGEEFDIIRCKYWRYKASRLASS